MILLLIQQRMNKKQGFIKNYKIDIGLTAVGIMYLLIIFLAIPIADRIWGAWADIALSSMCSYNLKK